MHLNSKHLFAKYALSCFANNPTVLEIGPDDEPSSYKRMVSPAVARWDTIDLVQRSVPLTHIAESDYSFPIKSDTYDIVLAGQVIEHVRKIWRWVPELARVTKHGGLVILVNPVTWHYHGFPTDCWRIYPDGMRALCDDANLTVRMSICENVQVARFNRCLPRFIARSHIFARLAGIVGLVHQMIPQLPFDGAFDTITIAEKRACSSMPPVHEDSVSPT